MKIGDYVRTLKGITKIIDIRDELIRDFSHGNEVVIETNKIITDNGLSVSYDYKSSPNIIDLIEDGDYKKDLQEKGKEIINLNNTIIDLHSVICEKQNKINRLNNIIYELEKYIEDNELYFDDELGLVEMMGAGETRIPVIKSTYLLDKLKELKEK